MASKRMFDYQIVSTDKFVDMPLTTKGLYFLLGMEADDRGFVSPRKVLRTHGGTEDDLKLLIAKGYLIYFESGVIVITDFNKHNYLDKNRIKETEFLNEYKQLALNDGKYQIIGLKPSVKQMFNECLTSIEESSTEEKSIEEISLELKESNINSKKNSDLENMKANVDYSLNGYSSEISQNGEYNLFMLCESEFGRVLSNYEINVLQTLKEKYSQAQIENALLKTLNENDHKKYNMNYLAAVLANKEKENV